MACGDRGVADFILNVILFMPLGVSLRLGGTRMRTAGIMGAVLSTFIELTQALIPGRDTTLGDVISNTTGALAGYLLASLVLVAVRRKPGPLTAPLWALGAMGIVALTGVALSPSYPPSTYYGQWTADLDGGLEWYRGRVQRATLGGMPMPSEELGDQPAVHRLLRQGAPLDVDANAGPMTTRIAPVFSIYDEDRREILLLGARYDDLIVRFWTRSLTWRLDRPYLTLKGTFGGLAVGDSLHLSYWRQGGRLCVLVNHRRSCDLGFTPGAGWSVLIYPESLRDWIRTLLCAMWIGGILLPAGFTVRTRIGGVATSLIVVIGLFAVPALVGLRSTTPLEWVGSLCGLAAGYGGRALLSRVRL